MSSPSLGLDSVLKPWKPKGSLPSSHVSVWASVRTSQRRHFTPRVSTYSSGHTPPSESTKTTEVAALRGSFPATHVRLRPRAVPSAATAQTPDGDQCPWAPTDPRALCLPAHGHWVFLRPGLPAQQTTIQEQAPSFQISGFCSAPPGSGSDGSAARQKAWPPGWGR